MSEDQQERPTIDGLLGDQYGHVRTAFERTVIRPEFNWLAQLGKARGGEQKLLNHSLSVLDTLAACLPFVAEESYPPLTQLEARGVLIAAFVHDAGKASEAFQTYLRGDGPPVEHVEPESIRSLAKAVAAEAGMKLGDAIDDIVSQAVLHDRRMRRSRGELSERGRDHQSLRWRKLADLVDAADSLASATTVMEADVFLTRSRQLVGGADVASYRTRLRGVSTTFLHSATLAAFQTAGWIPLRYFDDGTLFTGRGANLPDRDAVRRELERKLEELLNGRAEELAVLAVGAVTKDFLPSPEYVTEHNVDRLFDVAATKVRRKSKITDDERKQWTEQWSALLRERPDLAKSFPSSPSAQDLELLASSGPEICLLKLFKNLMDPQKGLCDSNDEQIARKLYEQSVGPGSYTPMSQQSTLMLVKDYLLVLAPWHRLPPNGSPKESAPPELKHLDPKSRERRIRDELIRMTREVFRNRRERGFTLPCDRLVVEYAGNIIADLTLERGRSGTDEIRRNLEGYSSLKATVAPRASKSILQCSQCSDTIEPGTGQEHSDALGNRGLFSNRRIAFEREGSPPICLACTVDLKLTRLCLGGPVRTVVGLVPPRGFGPTEAADLLERVQAVKRVLDRQLSPETLDSNHYVALSLPQQVLRQDPGKPLEERLVLPVTEKATLKNRQKRLAEALGEKLGGDDGTAELARELQLQITSAADLARAIVDGTAPKAIREDPDVAAAIRYAQRDALVEFAAITPNLLIVAMDREIAADREVDRALYQFGLAALFNTEFHTAALIAPPSELRSAMASRNGGAVYVPSNGPARRLLGADWISEQKASTWLRALQAAIVLQSSLGGDKVGPYEVLTFPSAGFAVRRAELSTDREPYWPTVWHHVEALKEVLG